MKKTLRSLICDILSVRRLLTREEIKKLAKENGYEESSAERMLRYDSARLPIPCTTLNSKKKPCKPNEHIVYYRWGGGQTIFKK